MSKLIKYFSLGFCIIIVDRLTKYYVMHAQHLIGTSFEPSINRGISWSMLSSDNPLVYASVSCFVLLFFSLLCLYTYKRYQDYYSIWPEIMIIAGACSNLIDRYLYQGVVDFINIQYSIINWPSFNIADVSICLGALIIIVNMLMDRS